MPDLFCIQCRALQLPEPIEEFRFHPTRRWRFDYAWPKLKLAVEIQGGIWVRGKHSRGAGQLNDWEKSNEAQLMGWSVINVTPAQIGNGQAVRLAARFFQGGEK